MKINTAASMSTKNPVGELGVDLNVAGLLKNLVSQIIADYQSKAGVFLQNKNILLTAKARVGRLARYANVQYQAGVVALKIDTLLQRQTELETTGAQILGVVSTIQNSPIVRDAFAGKLPTIYELEKWASLTSLYNTATGLKSQLLPFLSKIDIQNSDVQATEQEVTNLEKTSGAPVNANTWAGSKLFTTQNIIIAGSLLAVSLGLITKGFGLFHTVRKYRKSR